MKIYARSITSTLLALLLSQALSISEAMAATASGRTITAGADGAWSSPSTWSNATVPAAGDDVVIPAGRAVSYDLNSSVVLHTVTIYGNLTFTATTTTSLNAGLIKIGADARDNSAMCNGSMPMQASSGSLKVGSPELPVPRGVTATINLVPFSGQNPDDLPGLVNCGGRLNLHGSPIANPWTRMTANAPSGSSTVTVSSNISDWRVNDEIIIVGTRNEKSGFSDTVVSMRYGGTQTEKRTITAINGQTITFNSPLSHGHEGINGNFPEVANLTRTVRVQSSDLSSMNSRGHTMYHGYSSGAISYARFNGLGKEAVGGRYPIHVHMADATMRGFSVTGAAITESGNKFITLHRSDYILLRDNIGYRTNTSGFFIEDGTEVYNVLDRNLAVNAFEGTAAPDESLDYLSGGGFGFWWANGRNTLINNQSAENDSFGFNFELLKVSSYYGINYPQSQFLVAPMLNQSGIKADTQINTVPFFHFENNSCHNEQHWCMGISGGQWTVDRPSVLKNTKAWTTHYPVSITGSGVLIDGMAVTNSNYGIDIRYDYDSGNGSSSDITVKDASIDGASLVAVQLAGAGDNINFVNLRVTESATFTMPNYNYWSSAVVTFTGLSEDFNGAFIGKESSTEGNTPTIYVNDWYGGGRTAKILPSDRSLNDGLTYGPDGNIIDNSAKSANTANYTGYQIPSAVDDLAPASAITSLGSVQDGYPTALAPGNTLTLQGISSDNGPVSRVTVNGIQAVPLTPNFSRWQVTLPNLGVGTYVVTSTAQDAAGNIEQNPHVLTLNLVNGTGNNQSSAPTISTTTLPDATATQPYSATLSAGGGTTPYSWSLSGGSLPAGFSLASNGTISGTTTVSGSSSFTVLVRDAAGRTASRSLTLAVSPASVSVVNLASTGTIIAAVTNPTGGGSRNLEIIRDGDKPPVGNQDSARQYDTYDGNNTAAFDWIGYQYGSVQTFSRVVFQEGKHFTNGGWFDGQIKVQVRQNGVWLDVPTNVTPSYPGVNDNSSYQSYTFTFADTPGDAIRLYGAPGGTTAFISVGELEVYGTTTAASSVVKIAGDNQSSQPGTALANPLAVEVRDGAGVARPGVAVGFTVTSGGGTLSQVSATTNASGQASATLTLGAAPGNNTVVVSSNGALATTFNATATAAPAQEVSLASAGTIIAAVTNPTGGGNRNLETIRNGDKPPVGNQDSSRQYDTYDGNNAAAFDWIGYQYSSVKTFSRVVFQEGKHFTNGGWFSGALKVQVRQNGTWVMAAATVSPAYPSVNDGVTYQSYTFTFPAIQGDAIRLYGTPGGTAAFISVGELEVYGTP